MARTGLRACVERRGNGDGGDCWLAGACPPPPAGRGDAGSARSSCSSCGLRGCGHHILPGLVSVPPIRADSLRSQPARHFVMVVCCGHKCTPYFSNGVRTVLTQSCTAGIWHGAAKHGPAHVSCGCESAAAILGTAEALLTVVQHRIET
eukprot:1391947-Rhodomonas_salina.3